MELCPICSQGQHFRKVKTEFRDTHHGQEFRLREFSESVYDRLLHDEIALDTGAFFEEIQALVEHKMALGQYDKDADGKQTQKWVFRHDKMRDYFLLRAFSVDQESRVLKHLDDPRFSGVYLMLASQLPLDQARELKDALVDHAAETKDHYLSDAIVEVLKTRRSALSHSA
jgi:hypothetical protein